MHSFGNLQLAFVAQRHFANGLQYFPLEEISSLAKSAVHSPTPATPGSKDG
jgi:hypothetical protein